MCPPQGRTFARERKRAPSPGMSEFSLGDASNPMGKSRSVGTGKQESASGSFPCDFHVPWK